METLSGLLTSLDGVETDVEETPHEVWALSDSQGIANRTQTLVDDASDEIVLVVGDESALSEALTDSLTTAIDRGVTVIVGVPTAAIREHIENDVAEAQVFVSELEWMGGPAVGHDADAVAISRLCLIDRSNILVSSIDPTSSHERAVFGTGLSNGLVIIVRRLLSTGLLRQDDPGVS